MSAVSLRSIRKRFGATLALDGVDLEAEPGEVLALIGENGAGKSTLLNILSRGLRADDGKLETVEPVAHIRQELSLFPDLSVAENIFIGREPSRLGVIDRTRLETDARDLLREFGRPEIEPGCPVRALSASARQVVEICRALAGDARLILMDEPTSSLERRDVERLFMSIRRVAARGVTVLYVSHFLEEVREIATRAVVLRDGRTVWEGRLSEIDDASLIRHMIGRDAKAETAEPTAVGEEVTLAVSDVTGSTLEARRGEIVGIAGLVSSGRSEFVRAVFGLEPAERGSVAVDGIEQPARKVRPWDSVRRGVGYLSEDRAKEGLFPHLSTAENLTISSSRRDGADAWVRRLNIKGTGVAAPVTRLSGGNQQKVLVARILHQGAHVLLLDEPTRGIDVGAKAEIYALIRDLAAEGKTIVIVSSYLPELFALCHRIGVMARGRLTETRPTADWTPDSILEAAIGGAAA